MSTHYLAISAAYAVVVGGWWLAARILRRIRAAPTSWENGAVYDLPHAWREVGIALIGTLGVIGVGQLWSRRWLLPTTGELGPLLEAINQALIFAPILAVPYVRRQGPRTMLLPKGRACTRIAVGLALALIALSVYALARSGSRGPLAMASSILRYENLSLAVQVLGEDLAIGVLLFRLASAMSRRSAVVAVAALFALGHIPALVSGGAELGEIASLVFDFALGLLMVGTIVRSGDVLWFWPVHFALDMTQFERITGLA